MLHLESVDITSVHPIEQSEGILLFSDPPALLGRNLHEHGLPEPYWI
jgi:hypothetical protein